MSEDQGQENQDTKDHPSQNMNDDRETVQNFINEFEELAQKYGVKKYLATVDINGRPIMLWAPNDLNAACRTAKVLHSNLHQQVMMAIGDAVPPNEAAERQIAQTY